MTAGVFIVLDGIDGAGKTTQLHTLADWLRTQGHAVTPCVDPGGTALGTRLREVLLDTRQEVPLGPMAELLLFMASRAELVRQVIQPALARGDVVLSDRFVLSTVCYQGHAGGLDPQTIWRFGQLATGGLEPNLTLVLDLPVEVARTRQAGTDRFERRPSTFFEQLRAGFLLEARRRRRVVVVDGTASLDVVQERLRTEVAAVLARWEPQSAA
jgi:dTMP kinase